MAENEKVVDLNIGLSPNEIINSEISVDSGSYNRVMMEDGISVYYCVPSGGINSNTKVVYYMGDMNYASGAMALNENSNVLLVATPNNKKLSEAENVIACIDTFVDKCFETAGVQPYNDNVTFSGWSQDAKAALNLTAKYIESHSGCDNQVVYALDWGDDYAYGYDGGQNYFDFSTREQRADPNYVPENEIEIYYNSIIDTLVDNNATFVAVEPRMLEGNVTNNKQIAIRLENINFNEGCEDEAFYIPEKLVSLSKETDLKIVLATYEAIGNEGFDPNEGSSHVVAPISFVASFNNDPNSNSEDKDITFYSEGRYNLTVNFNPAKQYQWYQLDDGVANKITYSDFLKITNSLSLKLVDSNSNKDNSASSDSTLTTNFVSAMDKLNAIRNDIFDKSL